MKKIHLKGKLNLNKTIISELGRDKMDRIIGGKASKEKTCNTLCDWESGRGPVTCVKYCTNFPPM